MKQVLGRIGSLCLLVGMALGQGGWLRAEILEDLVAKVNNTIITRTQFLGRLEVVKAQLSRRYSGAELDRHTAGAHEATLRNMIVENLLVERGDLLLDMDKVRQNLLKDFKRQQNIETNEELDQLLEEQELTRRDLLDTLTRLAIPQEIINYEVRRKISVSENEIQKYYDDHFDEFVSPEQVTFRELVILFEEVTQEESRARAQAVRRELDAGVSFEELVDRESQAASRERGGLVGPFSIGELLPEIEEVVFTLPEGQIAGPIESTRALHFIRMETRVDKQVKALSEARREITENVRDSKFQDELEEYLENLWNDNYIYVYPNYGVVEWKPPASAGDGSGPIP